MLAFGSDPQFDSVSLQPFFGCNAVDAFFSIDHQYFERTKVPQPSFINGLLQLGGFLSLDFHSCMPSVCSVDHVPYLEQFVEQDIRFNLDVLFIYQFY